MSHFKNVQSLDKVIAICTGLGGNYNPGQQNLHVSSLVTLLNNAQAALEAIKVAKTNSEYATNHREVAFKDLRKLAGRIISELKSTGVLVQTVADARYIHRKLTGFRISRDPIAIGSVPAASAEVPASEKKSIARGLDFGTQADYFGKLLQTLRTEPSYQPGIEDLKLVALEAKLNDLLAKNATVVRTSVALKNARMYRNDLLYSQSGNVQEAHRAVKQQVKAAFGPRSEEFKSLVNVKFIKPANL
jgi:hypothetical protein